MKRNNLEAYKNVCLKVIERADNRCEVMIDENGDACSSLPKHRCNKYILTEQTQYINFLHKATRNGKSVDWVMNPDNIVFGCAKHHIEEERTGIRVQSIEYDKDELIYIEE
jgi:hypothetical protein